MEASEKKGWSFLILKKIAVLMPYIMSLAYIGACACVMLLAADMFKTSGAEMDALIEAGDLPACVRTYALSLFGMLAGAMMLLARIRRR